MRSNRQPVMVRPPTARELQIIGGCARGMSNADIAAELELTEHTVKSHLRRAMAAVGARDRAHAVAVAMREGWLGDQRPAGPHRRPDLARYLEHLGRAVDLVLVSGEVVACQLAAIVPDGVAVITRPLGEHRRYRDRDVHAVAVKINDAGGGL